MNSLPNEPGTELKAPVPEVAVPTVTEQTAPLDTGAQEKERNGSLDPCIHRGNCRAISSARFHCSVIVWHPGKLYVEAGG